MPLSSFKTIIKNNFPLTSFIFRNKKQILSLGRWGIDCDKGKAINADNANEDHCGQCGTNINYDPKQKYQDIEKNIEYYKNKK